ncbi:MAG: class I SAM-dependent methyltransferase [Anaerolineae bacterium]|nr:class I SAM-dependent methyltransferase [Anaerolineae bacterium]
MLTEWVAARGEGETCLPFALVCPICRYGLAVEDRRAWCRQCGRAFEECAGIWRFLPEPRAQAFAQFLREYQLVRAAEGWGATHAGYYRALPYVAKDDPQRDIWCIRVGNYHALIERVIIPMERQRQRPLRVLDLGAGNGWLAYRLAQRGHHVAAVDISLDAKDGLGAHIYYDSVFIPIQAEFDHLPFAGDQADLAIFNASLHYSTDCASTLAEALRVLKEDGWVVVLDTPVYCDEASGAQMVCEREERFRQRYGFPSNAIPSENYLTYVRLEQLAVGLGLCWQVFRPFPGWRWRLRSWRARLLGQREPAQFPLLIGRRKRRRAGDAFPLAVRFKRVLWRALLAARFQLFQRHRYRRLVLEEVAGRPILVLPEVFNPKLFRTGEFLAQVLAGYPIPPEAEVLDMGTGSGIGAVIAALRARRVVAVDINPAAVRCARINALLNQVEDRVEVRQGDLFAPVRGERFDVVLFNPPYFRGRPRDVLDQAFHATDVAERFAASLPDHLNLDGYALVLLSTDGDVAGFLQAFQANGLAIDAVTERDLGNEVFTVYRVTMRRDQLSQVSPC